MMERGVEKVSHLMSCWSGQNISVQSILELTWHTVKAFMKASDPRYIRPITHDNHRTVSYFHIRSPLSLQSPPPGLSLWPGVESWSLVPGPPAWLWETPGPAPESPLVPGTGFSVPVNTALAEEVVNHNQELNFSPIFCNNRSILWSIMALQWIRGGVTMRKIITYNTTSRLWNNKTKVRAMFCQSQMRF